MKFDLEKPVLKVPIETELKYGSNPYQTPAKAKIPKGFEIYIKNSGYINWIDISRAWMCVLETSQALGKPVAASYKHTSAAGLGTFLPFNDVEEVAFTRGKKIQEFLDEGNKLSPQSVAYLRATWPDRSASFGEVVALSEPLDLETAVAMSNKQVDAIVCPTGIDKEALDKYLLQRGYIQDRKGIPIILVTDEFEPAERVGKKLKIGVELTEPANNLVYDYNLFRERDEAKDFELYSILMKGKNLTLQQKEDIILTAGSVANSESNNVGIGGHGSAICRAGGQSRVESSGDVARKWVNFQMLKHHKVLNYPVKSKGFTNQHHERVAEIEKMSWELRVKYVKENFPSVSVSDAFFPFKDGPEKLLDVGVDVLVEPGGSKRDQDTLDLAGDYEASVLFARIKNPLAEKLQLEYKEKTEELLPLWFFDWMARLFLH